jgi:hypothetical protein
MHVGDQRSACTLRVIITMSKCVRSYKRFVLLVACRFSADASDAMRPCMQSPNSLCRKEFPRTCMLRR